MACGDSGSSSSPQVPYYLQYVDQLPSAPAENYRIIKLLEFGGFNRIHKVASSTADPEGPNFAMKTKIEGLGITNAERMEVHALKTLENENNIVRMVDIIRSPVNLTIVMSLAKTDLSKIMTDRHSRPISSEEKRTILYQLFNGLAAIHKHNIIHRDIKAGNVLISFEGIVQITDFGMSEMLLEGEKRSPRGGTLSYKAMELLMEDEEYDEKVDMWAAGCTMAELWLGDILFNAGGMDQLRAIAKYCGFPTVEDWPRMATFKFYTDAKFLNSDLENRGNHLKPFVQKFTKGDALVTDLLLKLLQLNPERRVAPADALNHEYFTNAPLQPHVKSLFVAK